MKIIKTDGHVKICIFTSEHRVLDARIFYREAVSLANYGYEVHVFGDHPKCEIIKNVYIHAIPRSISRINRKIFVSLKYFIKVVKQKADLYHFHDPALVPCGIALRLIGKNVIMDVHEDFKATFIHKRNYAPKWFLITIAFLFDCFEKFSAKIFSGVVTVSEEIQRKFKGANIVLVRNFPITSEYNNIRREDKKELKIVYTGTITQARGCWEILDAFKKFIKQYPCGKLYIVGNFESEQLEIEFKSKASEIGSVKILGLLSWEETKNIQENSDIGLLISHFRNHTQERVYPVKLFEYMSAGIPVIFSKKIFLMDLLRKYCFGKMVDGKNPLDIANAMLELAVDPNKRLTLGKAGRDCVEKEFSWKKEFNKLNSLYEKILSEKENNPFGSRII